MPSRDNGTSNRRRWDFRKVHRDTVTDHTDSDTENKSTDDEEGDGSDDDQLEDTSDGNNDDCSSQGALSSEVVSQEGSTERSNEFTGLDDGRKDRGVL